MNANCSCARWMQSRRRCGRPPSRKGMATLVVLLLVAVALAVSYSVMRSQATTLHIQQNANLAANARRAAVMGMIRALRAMQTSDWSGVDVSLSGQASEHESYEVRFTTGDESLEEDSVDYWLYPYRVTLSSIGMAVDPANSTRKRTHEVRAVVQLVPRALADKPPIWEDVLGNTVFQWGPWGEYEVPVPFRIEGNQKIQGYLKLAKDYNWLGKARERYLKDLNEMSRGTETIDVRPFTGKLWYPYHRLWLMYIRQDGDLNDIFDVPKAISREDLTPQQPPVPDSPTRATEYQLYPGGKKYQIEPIHDRNLTTSPETDLRKNPLGLFRSNGELRIGDDVIVRGTLLAKGGDSGDVVIEGRNVRLSPVELLPLAGTRRPIRLPAVVAEDDMRFRPSSQAIITGLIAVYNDFEIQSSDHDGLAVSGTARIDNQSIAATDNSCTLRAVDVNIASLELLVGAKFRIAKPGCSTCYTVRKCAPVPGEAKVVIEFTPSWGNPTPEEGDEVCFGPADATGTVVTIRGRVVAREVHIHGHSNWAKRSSNWWEKRYDEFQAQLPDKPYFPLWLQQREPELVWWPSSTIKPEPADTDADRDNDVWYHWKNSYDPIYMPHPDDEGLCWELLEWTDNP